MDKLIHLRLQIAPFYAWLVFGTTATYIHIVYPRTIASTSEHSANHVRLFLCGYERDLADFGIVRRDTVLLFQKNKLVFSSEPL